MATSSNNAGFGVYHINNVSQPSIENTGIAMPSVVNPTNPLHGKPEQDFYAGGRVPIFSSVKSNDTTTKDTATTPRKTWIVYVVVGVAVLAAVVFFVLRSGKKK